MTFPPERMKRKEIEVRLRFSPVGALNSGGGGRGKKQSDEVIKRDHINKRSTLSQGNANNKLNEVKVNYLQLARQSNATRPQC